MARKTINIAELTASVNKMLSESTLGPEQRRGMITVLESVLLSTGNYRGFGYLTESEVPPGHRPGVNISPVDGQHMEDYDARFHNTDTTRVHYY